MRLRRLALAALLLVLAGARAAEAQSDVIRGRIIGPDSTPVERALVTVTSLNGNVSRNTRTGTDGRYTITFPGADGDYFVNVAALGFAPKRFQIKRIGDQEIIIGNAKLGVAVQQLDAVNVRADRQRAARGDSLTDVSGSERATTNAVSFDQLSDLAALAASLPGVQYIPGTEERASGFSVLALSADQNATTLNGLAFGGSSLPRDANVSTSLVTTPYDVSRGNFSGGLLNVRTLPGSNYIVRAASFAFDAPQAQWTDAAGRALGQRYRNVSAGGRFSGPISFDKAFYSIAYQAGRRTSDFQSLTNTDAIGLRTAGVAMDSVTRLLSILERAGVPLGGRPGDRTTDNASIFGTFDLAPPTSTSGEAFNLTFNGTWTRQNPGTAAPTQLPSSSGEVTNWFGGVQLRQSGYYGIGILSETSVGLNRFNFSGSPFVDLPSGVVRVSSSFETGTSSVQNIAFGGNAMSNASQTLTSAQAMNQLSWFSESNQHRLKLTSELRRDQFAQDLTPNRLGTFGFNSLADLDAVRPAMFVRTIGSRERSVGQYVAAVSLGDTYRPISDLQLQFGVRVDGNRFTSVPAANAEVARLFGVANDRLPTDVYVSPRVGFSWATLRGGVGVFQGMPNVTQIGDAMDNTGLAGATTQLSCVGSAVPTPDWAAYAASVGAIPTRCADGSTATPFGGAAPNVALFAKGYTAPRSVRSNLQWSSAILDNRVSATIDATYSLNLAQPSVVDLNFDPSARLTLSDEGRRVFASDIVAATGAIAAGQGRISPLFTRVMELRSDMRSETKQLMVQLRPTSFSSSYAWAVSYVYARARERFRGFASAGGDPREAAWSRSSLDSRHQFVYAFTYNWLDFVRASWYGTLRSGLPYTPVVAGDVNGDGFANDRAFVFNGGSQACLQRQVGRIAARNSCEGPWTATGALTLSFNPLKIRLPQRADLSFQLRGWERPWTPVNQLLFVRGFDPATRRFKYEVNQRFGEAQDRSRQPVTLTAILRVDVGPTREQQSLTQMLDRGRRGRGQRFSEGVIKSLYGTSSVVNPMAQILRQADSLELTGIQADSVAVLNRRYSARLDSIWTPVAKYLASLPDEYERGVAYERYKTAREKTVDLLIELSPVLKSLLTTAQLRKLPSMVTPYLDSRYLASVRSGTAGTGLGAVMMDGLALPPGVGNAQAATIMMIHGGGTP